MIIPEIIELNFDSDTIERLYNIADYNVVSRHQAGFEVSTFKPIESDAHRVPNSLGDYSGQWMQTLSGNNSVLADSTAITGSQIPWSPDHNSYYISHSQAILPEIGTQRQINQGMSEVMSDQMIL